MRGQREARNVATEAQISGDAEYRLFVENASDGFIVSDDDGRILEVNTRACEIFGYSAEEMRGRNIADLVQPADVRRKPPQLDALRRGERVVIEREGRRKDGSSLHFEVSARMAEDGRIVGIVRDMTESDRNTRTLRRQTSMLEERVKEQACLYAVSRVLARDDRSLPQALDRVAALLPDGWQFPELASARIRLGDSVHVSEGWHDSPFNQRADIVVDGVLEGEVEVAYDRVPEDPSAGGTVIPAGDGRSGEAGIFLVEERALLEELASRIGAAVRQHRIDDRLRRSEAYYRTLAEKSTDLISIISAEGEVLYDSPALTAALGFTPEEREGGNIMDLIHPDDLPLAKNTLREALGNPDHQATMEVRVRHADGGWRVLEAVGRNLLHDPSIRGIVIESRDVTARRAAEDRVRFQARLLDAVGQAVLAGDVEGRVVYWNRAAESIFGISREDALGRSVEEMLPTDREATVYGELRRTLEAGDPWSGELEVMRPDGVMVPIRLSTTLLQEGEQVTGFVTVAMDVTTERTADRALRESEERLRSLFANSSDLIVILDEGGRISYSSPNRQEILGQVPEDQVGRSARGLPNVHPEDRNRANALWKQVYAEPGAEVTAQVRVAHGEGGHRMLEIKAKNLLDKPAIRGVVVNARDVSERIELEDQLRQAQKMEAIGRLAGGVAHDFNNLLTGIQGYAQLALDEVDPTGTAFEYLKEVLVSSERAERVTRQLLAFSRRQMMAPRVLNLNRALLEMHGMLIRLIGEDVRLETDLADGVGCLRVDPGQLEQVVLNLAVNSRDAMPDGGELRISTRRVHLDHASLEGEEEGLEPGWYVELTVQDTGAGMQPGTLSRVFEPFFTTKALGKGTGLGLSTVYGIVRQSGGVIRVNSEVGKGTRFRVYFPAVDETPDTPPEQAPQGDHQGRETILLVEDDASVRGLAEKVLARQGYQVVTAIDGREAVDLLADGWLDRLDLVLSDVVMPHMGGRELLERIRQDRPGLPTILMSGYTDDVILRHGARNVASDFLEKPFTPATLVERVRAVLDAPAADDA